MVRWCTSRRASARPRTRRRSFRDAVRRPSAPRAAASPTSGRTSRTGTRSAAPRGSPCSEPRSSRLRAPASARGVDDADDRDDAEERSSDGVFRVSLGKAASCFVFRDQAAVARTRCASSTTTVAGVHEWSVTRANRIAVAAQHTTRSAPPDAARSMLPAARSMLSATPCFPAAEPRGMTRSPRARPSSHTWRTFVVVSGEEWRRRSRGEGGGQTKSHEEKEKGSNGERCSSCAVATPAFRQPTKHKTKHKRHTTPHDNRALTYR